MAADRYQQPPLQYIVKFLPRMGIQADGFVFCLAACLDDKRLGFLAVEIAARFKVDLSELVSGSASKLKTFCVTRAGYAPEVSRRPMYGYWNLAYNFHRKKAEPFLVEASAETENRPISLNTHPGQEFNFLLEGRLLISISGHDIELGPGDCVFYDSSEPHGMKALGGSAARFLAFVF